MQKYYKKDLAYIHDVGHADFALKSAPGILEILDRNRIRDGLVVDLGCGSGLWARELTKANYKVIGVDISESMISIARRRAPDAEFRMGSLFNIDIPPCSMVTSIGECLNYLFDQSNSRQKLIQLFSRIYTALTVGGLFVFDIAEPGQVPQGAATRGYSEGKDWIVMVEKREDRQQEVLTRRITSFRKVGRHYRRGDEVHHQRLYKSADIARELRGVGFRVRAMRSYGSYDLPKRHAAFIARKPS
jgi:SAM-dependent methyltransferase